MQPVKEKKLAGRSGGSPSSSRTSRLRREKHNLPLSRPPPPSLLPSPRVCSPLRHTFPKCVEVSHALSGHEKESAVETRGGQLKYCRYAECLHLGVRNEAVLG
ncbi:hypothetical protein E2C01_020881 [Portunus trituberculatus]|uniref:Uncharacterized protein n=1 Tax=Portunus trituberculatus TaxID=210409 RepID=A0A5B7E132_PORTR|nr:hypothetical protein [Portunus trituberculatus]